MRTTETPEYLSVAEAASLLNLSEPTTYRRVWDGSFPVVRLSERGDQDSPRGARAPRGWWKGRGASPQPAWARDEPPDPLDGPGARLYEEAAVARLQVRATRQLPVDQQAAAWESTEEERARRGSRPTSRRWRALNKLDERVDALTARQTEATQRLADTETRLEQAPHEDARILADWIANR